MKLLLIVLPIVILDQLSKYHIQKSMQEGMSIPVAENIFHITYILNTGAAFGMLENQRWFFVFTALFLLVAVAVSYRKILQQPFLLQLGIGLLVGGAVGNLIDRIRLGKVVDFFDFRIWPIFNVADIAICLGAGLILWMILKKEGVQW